ncbi:MAG: hypothetical protein R2764_09370 [Bacteroidales bacterium]
MEWGRLREGAGNPIYALGYELREKFSGILDENGIKGKEFAVASAILLGYDEYLDSDHREGICRSRSHAYSMCIGLACGDHLCDPE